ncbi:hypothetical protein BO94DRAFT_285994 [Aspergillus sclerotioniger CBS 115572]|uniref:Uncharacterized protein n=1 Tax=Aspergillus sclerotioniger CBS 115572 TaxID=1450535 RepID=A0A317X8C2_9EURO|nr:hypothetical protein BO94DRAFT_285994 [Aspergillus sclerotioniger CBS 115572]PWY94843.1 hypothetical protein BO94DRAFT_285994 [Aspergillus sclerotioniger CBS 115572]
MGTCQSDALVIFGQACIHIGNFALLMVRCVFLCGLSAFCCHYVLYHLVPSIWVLVCRVPPSHRSSPCRVGDISVPSSACNHSGLFMDTTVQVTVALYGIIQSVWPAS